MAAIGAWVLSWRSGYGGFLRLFRVGDSLDLMANLSSGAELEERYLALEDFFDIDEIGFFFGADE